MTDTLISESLDTAPQFRHSELLTEAFPEALESMVQDGYAVIKGFVPAERCQSIVNSLDPKLFRTPALGDLRVAQGRLEYGDFLDPIPTDDLFQIEDQILDAVDESVTTYPQLAKWTLEAGSASRHNGHRLLGRMRRIYSYARGHKVEKHLDRPNEDFPTTGLLTLSGREVFRVYSQPDDETPAAEIEVGPGDLILLRGREFPGGQLAHSVETTEDRILYTFGADPDYNEDRDIARSKQERNERLSNKVQSRQGSLPIRLGRSAMRLLKPATSSRR